MNLSPARTSAQASARPRRDASLGRAAYEAEALRAACLLDGIELGEPLGTGGSATVWAARWRGREAALKVFARADAAPPTPPGHPAIAAVLGRGRALGRPYLLLERFPTDLRRLLGGRPLRADLLRPVVVPLLDAVEFAHRRGIVHGDLKPGNVLVDPDARPVRVGLTDFGHGGGEALELVASLASGDRREREEGLATLPYLAPERRAGAGPSAASDAFALGVLLFELLTGRQPVGLELPSELVPALGPRFDEPVKRALASDPGRRLDVLGLRAELLRLLGGPAQARAPEPDAMVAIPGGFVVVGDRDDPSALPMNEVRLAPFWLDRTPVTNRDYLRFVLATGAPRPAPWPARGRLPARLLDLPVSGVSWEEAAAFAAWAGKRLPREEEWERAAQGPEHRSYPYGEALDRARLPAPGQLAPVGAHPAGASSEGIHDLTGNGWEWTGSDFALPGGGRAKVIRGGFDPARPRSGSAHHRAALRPDARDAGVTFRCARDA